MPDERQELIAETAVDIRARISKLVSMGEAVDPSNQDEMLFAAYAMGDSDATRRLTGKLPDGVVDN